MSDKQECGACSGWCYEQEEKMFTAIVVRKAIEKVDNNRAVEEEGDDFALMLLKELGL